MVFDISFDLKLQNYVRALHGIMFGSFNFN